MPKTAAHDPAISTVVFRNPPSVPRYEWEEIARQLRARPLEWALIFEGGSTSRANAIRDGRVQAVHPDLGFEMRTANNTRVGSRTCDLYLRWNPEKERNQ